MLRQDPIAASVVIATLETPHVDRVVRSLASQTLPKGRYEVIVSDTARGRWKAAMEAIQSEFADLNLTYTQLDRSPLWRTKGMNAAIRLAKGAILVLLAEDFTPQSDFLPLHLRFHETHPEENAVAVAPAYFVPHQAEKEFVRWLEATGRIFGSDFQDEDAHGFFYGGNASLKRSFYDRTGGFDEAYRYDATDDYDLGERLRDQGMRSYYLPAAWAWHEHTQAPTLTDRARANFYAGEGARIFESKYPERTHDWSRTCARHPWRLRADAWLWGGLYLLSRNARHRHNYYSCWLDAAFSAGWRSAAAASTITGPDQS